MKIKSLIIAGILGTALASQGAVLYQSNFSGTTLTEAGLASVGLSGGIWDSPGNDRVKANLPGGNDRAAVYTTDVFQSDAGFILNVTFNQLAAGDNFSIGLVDATAAISGNDWLNPGVAKYGIGLVTDGQLEGVSGDALGFNNGTGSGGDVGGSSVLSTAQGNITLNSLQTLSIIVTPNSYSYSLNGAAATTGALTFDTSKQFRFIAVGQDDIIGASYISNITLSTVVPEPSTLALLGTGLGVLMVARRVKRVSANAA